MTYATDLGYEVGDKFRLINSIGQLPRGCIVTLDRDDGTEIPYFITINKVTVCCSICGEDSDVELISKSTRHKHYDLIVAWADGADIEFDAGHNHWLLADPPMWDDTVEYRLAQNPEIIVLNGKKYKQLDIERLVEPIP